MIKNKIRTIEMVLDWQGKIVLVRASLNVPLKNGVVENNFRLKKILPTLQYLSKRGAKIVMIGHIGRERTDSLYPVWEALSKLVDIKWGGDYFKYKKDDLKSGLGLGEVLLLENLRQNEGEVKNESGFASDLANLADIYVNDAFANLHREHASMVGVPKCLPAYAGLHLESEIMSLESAMSPASPSLFILGGAKFQTKIHLVENYLNLYDEIFIGGALAHDIMRARGYEVGRSLVSDVSLEDFLFVNSNRILIPKDVIVHRADQTQAIVKIEDVLPDDVIYDCGPDTVSILKEKIHSARTILWNGPLGNFEIGYHAGTEAVATAIADSNANSYVGGGDTVSAISDIRRDPDFTFISTGGGAMLSYLEHGELPALNYLLGE